MMSNDRIQGLDLNGAVFWMAESIGDLWLGTGKDQSRLIRHLDLRAAIQFYLTWYPRTDTIQAVLDGQYRVCVPGQAAMSIIDAVLKEIDPPAPEPS